MFTSGMLPCKAAVALALLVAAIAPAQALPPGQPVAPGYETALRSGDRLVNLDTPVLPARGQVTFRGDLRVFGSDEDLTYGALQVGYGATDDLAVLFRAALTDEKDFTRPGFRIRHGGNDFELLVKYRLPQRPNWAATLGLSADDTPAQDDVFLTAQILYERPLNPRSSFYFAPKAVFIKDNTLVGLAGGVVVRLTDTLQFVGDVTGLVAGDNTYSVHSGDRKRDAVWGAILRYTPRPGPQNWSVDIGVTSGIGGTTGFSLTPGLGSSVAFLIGFSVQR